MKAVATKTLSLFLLTASGIDLTGQNPPAPTEDRVGFPTAYQSMQVMYVFDRPDNKQVRTIFGNPAAASVRNGNQASYPYGSVLVMETWRALQDRDGNPILDGNGRYQKDPAAVPTLFVMRKGQGFGVDYGPNRTGEWEYVAYRPDGTVQTTPRNSFSCAICHTQAGGGKDWVFRNALRFNNGGHGPVPDYVMKNYKYIPATLRVRSGAFVTFYNDDVTDHTITDDVAGGGDSGRMRGGSSLTVKFTEPGEFRFHCSIHPSMRGTIVVE
jgi:plastocyanin